MHPEFPVKILDQVIGTATDIDVFDVNEGTGIQYNNFKPSPDLPEFEGIVIMGIIFSEDKLMGYKKNDSHEASVQMAISDWLRKRYISAN